MTSQDMAFHYVSVTDEGDGKHQGNYDNDGATVLGAIAIGPNASASVLNSVALGANSMTGSFSQVSDATIGNTTYGGFAGSARGVVSVGGPGAERQITHVAPGAITSASTDAINGSQLYSAVNGLEALIASVRAELTTLGNQ
ncbi:hypothetical protein [Paraburkholderia humisilvae]|uniref:Trimeric autotransporter adhesin YadA-like stalk domain-containing protein n=1 Tax=Paraburkholderia humisilvae TaxID=627669 RepID=A0A6J5F9A6_9BURK|nr:hypothetical protein [Paraburkholderia humisilvae]CAB3775064.1 hypothetical protein LMG29542_08446 [Paraburkholderia humisilvae]